MSDLVTAADGRSVRLGLNLTVQYGAAQDPARAVRDCAALVAAARDAGWASVFVSQHYLGRDTAHLHPVPLLASLIGTTGAMELGVGVSLLALGNPVDLAEAYGTIDVLSGGRLVLGVGLGYRDVELEAFGVTRAARSARLTTNLDCLTRLWTGESVSLTTDWCTLRDERLALLPLQRPRPPVWVAGNADAAVARAARLGDAWLINPHSRISTIQQQQVLYRRERQRAGLPPAARTPLMREVVCAPTTSVAVSRASRHLARKYATYTAWGQDAVQPPGDGFSSPFDELAHDRFVVGDPDRCRAVLQDWVDRTAATDLILRVHWAGQPVDEALESLELISTTVAPFLTPTRESDEHVGP